MDIFKSDSTESPTLYDAGTTRRASRSDEEVLLATSHPKKRAGRRVFKETRHPIYRGVRRRNTNKWVCELREPNKKSRIWLGTYPTPEMAARAHDVAALALRGKSACLNFAHSAAAEAIRPRESVQVVSDEESIIAEASAEEANTLSPENCFFMDEEAVFDMPGLISNMAEGLLLSPPLLVTGDDDHWDDGVSLWSFSF
ncbi:hypothetical protein ACOSQ3_026142 [Xanthoceras sorbifolium]